MDTFSLGLIIETVVALLLVLTIGYCFVLNQRLKKLHADRDELKAMVADLVRATELANRAIAGIKQAAGECDTQLSNRLAEVNDVHQKLKIQVEQGRGVLSQVQKIVHAARKDPPKSRPLTNRPTGASGALEVLDDPRRLGARRPNNTAA